MPKEDWERRVLPTRRWHGILNPWPNASPENRGDVVQTWSQDLIRSEDTPHHRWRISKGIPTGGNFEVKRRLYSEFSTLGTGVLPFTTSPSLTGGYRYEAPQYAYFSTIGNGSFPSLSPSSDLALAALGREAIALTAPTGSSFDAATFVAELRAGLPQAIGFTQTGASRTARARSAGSEYLNVEFGWKPLERDAHSFGYTVANAGRLWQQYQENARKLIRVSYRWPTEMSTTITDLGTRQARPTMMSQVYNDSSGNGHVTLTQQTRREVWFKGVFKYWLPDGDLQKYNSRANHLYGTNLDPEALWNATPWSWGADWIGDAGTLMSILSHFSTDNLVMPWAYVMETKSVKNTYEWRGTPYRSYPGEQYLRQVLETVTKKRISANPYGFLVDWDDLSQDQWAILGALGLSRS